MGGRKTRKLVMGLVIVAVIVFSFYLISRTGTKHIVPAGFYYVNYVYDGDTVEVDMNGIPEKIRLIGVDTPETHKPNTPVQCYGVLASEFTKSHLEHKSIRLESDEINQDRDRYGRLLRYVYTEEGTLWNSELIRLGYGRALLAFPFTKSVEFESIEKTAKANNIGLWASCQ